MHSVQHFATWLLFFGIHIVPCSTFDPQEFYTNELFNHFGINDSLSIDQLDHLINGFEKKEHDESPASTVNCSHSTWSNNKECLKLKCLSSQEVASLLNVTSLTMTQFQQLCPALVYQAQNHNCVHFVTNENEQKKKPTAAEVWGYGFLFVTIISVASMLGILVLPLMNKVFYQWLLLFMVALAVGTIAGNCFYLLIPDVYGLEENDKEKRYIWKSTVVIGGIYMFFLVERSLKMLTDWKTKKQQKKNLNNSMIFQSFTKQQNADIFNVSPKLIAHTPSREQLVKTTENANEGMAIETISNGDLNIKTVEEHAKMKKKKQILPVAWMITIGDGLHNFVDGVAIGAAFTKSITSGISISVAVVCEELPHELGDFAILHRSGMSRCQAAVFNLLATATCYLGLIVGIILGENLTSDEWIFAVATGMFLYVALVNMMNDVNRATDEERFKDHPWKLFFIQNFGMIVGFGCIFLLAFYEETINFD